MTTVDAPTIPPIRLTELTDCGGCAAKLGAGCASCIVASQRLTEARRVGEAALYVDLASAAVHVGYARALAVSGDHERAAFELESALLCEAQPPELATAHALLARERLTMGDTAGARKHHDEALRLDPNNPEARSLKL